MCKCFISCHLFLLLFKLSAAFCLQNEAAPSRGSSDSLLFLFLHHKLQLLSLKSSVSVSAGF